MAIEIDEMVVRATTGQAAQASAPESGESNTGASPQDAEGGQDMAQVKKALLAECREMLLEILADREER
jgi:hypothetical protein